MARRHSANDPFPVMEHMTPKMVREYLTRSQSIIVPLGVIEQHGSHLPLLTDALIASRMGWLIGRKLGMLVAPVIYQSFSGGACPGTINISPAVMSQVVGDTLLSLASQGFRNFYLFLCHGGSENARALDDALKMLLRNNPAFERSLIALLPVWAFPAGGIGWDKALKEGDWHAGWLETSIVMALAPELVRMDELEMDDPALVRRMIQHPDNYQHSQKIVNDPFVIPRMTQRPDVRVGVMGFPRRASVARGKKIVAATVDSVARKIQQLDAAADGRYREVPYTPPPLLLKQK